MNSIFDIVVVLFSCYFICTRKQFSYTKLPFRRLTRTKNVQLWKSIMLWFVTLKWRTYTFQANSHTRRIRNRKVWNILIKKITSKLQISRLFTPINNICWFTTYHGGKIRLYTTNEWFMNPRNSFLFLFFRIL